MTDPNVKDVLSILKQVKVIGFDLDDTLWDNRPVIRNAIDKQFEFLVQHTQVRSVTELQSLYNEIALKLYQSEPTRVQNVSWLRKETLKRLVARLELANSIAEKAFEVFYQARQCITPYPEAIELLEQLHKHWKLIAISNGNSSLQTIGLAKYFEYHWRGGEQGLAKPSGDLLTKSCEFFGIQPNQLLYVGDELKVDAEAAKHAGCHCLIISGIADDQGSEYKNVFRMTHLLEFNRIIKTFDKS